ncbi:hypothetical protein Pcinc_035484 [Petrolisthes cinctipes]|uniref:Uncharacterized protein n=1 Tax=Petrolisthes cinctipes TaxID=88211 RepID=A0AAE1EPV1_PETCI|nr:hypothetical protein Pcinc_035484 [Petrolisthes cinctipes]
MVHVLNEAFEGEGEETRRRWGGVGVSVFKYLLWNKKVLRLSVVRQSCTHQHNHHYTSPPPPPPPTTTVITSNTLHHTHLTTTTVITSNTLHHTNITTPPDSIGHTTHHTQPIHYTQNSTLPHTMLPTHSTLPHYTRPHFTLPPSTLPHSTLPPSTLHQIHPPVPHCPAQEDANHSLCPRMREKTRSVENLVKSQRAEMAQPRHTRRRRINTTEGNTMHALPLPRCSSFLVFLISCGKTLPAICTILSVPYC